ncbi:MAG TPA: hypothetical protein VFU37_14260, partial [Pyrinomonadaceae bacterium]|nr:hypothetical protein [Pyrinomonadaceae bacterium]
TEVLTLAFICKKCEIPIGYAFTTPLGLSLFYTALLISVVNVLRGKGLTWKDRRVYARESTAVAGSEPNNWHRHDLP